MREFINKVIIAAIAIFAAIFWLNSQGHGSLVDDFLAETFPGISAPSVQIENPINVDLGEVAGALEEINVAGLREVDYDREGQFGPAWKDIDGNGCDTRNDILARDLTDITLDKDDCTVLTGTLVDPYTGETIDFQRGVKTSHKVQIDHIVPLSTAARTGALDWSQDKRERFANDPVNLIASDGPQNASKGDKGPGDWMPPNKAFHCDYVAMYINVVDEYGLDIPPKDAKKSKSVLESCS